MSNCTSSGNASGTSLVLLTELCILAPKGFAHVTPVYPIAAYSKPIIPYIGTLAIAYKHHKQNLHHSCQCKLLDLHKLLWLVYGTVAWKWQVCHTAMVIRWPGQLVQAYWLALSCVWLVLLVPFYALLLSLALSLALSCKYSRSHFINFKQHLVLCCLCHEVLS